MTYTYDASGQRITKRGPQGETAYINQWFTLRNGEVGTKHVFAGTSRVVSKLVKQDKPNSKRKGKIVYEKDQYYYHPDHLGTTAYITHTNGQIYQHLEYFPFGETWVEEHSNKQRTPYLFTAKELDEETGLYYFGARYYDPRTSVWQSTDPMLESYMPPTGQVVNLEPISAQKTRPTHDLKGMGGAFTSVNLGVYSYSHVNPINYRDPDGNEATTERPSFSELVQHYPTPASLGRDELFESIGGLVGVNGQIPQGSKDTGAIHVPLECHVHLIAAGTILPQAWFQNPKMEVCSGQQAGMARNIFLELKR